MNDVKIPKLRFKKDDGSDYPEWEEQLLKNIACYITTTAIGTKSSFVGTENMKKGCLGVVFANDTETIVKGISYSSNDVLVSNIRPYLQKAWKADRSGVCSTDVLCIRGNEVVDSNFLYVIISSSNFFDYVMQGAKGTKMPRGDKKHIMNMSVSLPCLEEQKKIADFLSTVDEVIFQSEKEVKALEQSKKAMMQRIFSREIRFKREDGTEFSDWEKKELSYCFESRDTKQIPTDEAPLMAFIAYKGVADKGDRYDRSYLVKTDNKKYKRTEYNDFIYSSNNLDVGSIGLNKYGTAVISVVYEIFKVKETAIPDFVNVLVQTPENMYKIIQYRQGCLYGQYKIFADDFLSVKTAIPCLEEQQKIADFLSSYDEAITYAKQELEHWKQLKKGLLQQMFV